MELRPERHVLDSDTISRILRKDNSVIRKFEAAFEVGSV